MSSAITRKRSIAGAIRPAYSEQDKIQMWEEDGVPHRGCVAYGYADTLNAQGQSILKELGTRADQNASKPANPKAQSVQFLPNSELRKKPDV